MRRLKSQLALLSCLLLTATTSHAVPSVLVKVVDPEGKPVPQFEAMVFLAGSLWGSWQEYSTGQFRPEGLFGRELGGKTHVWIRAAGYAAQCKVIPVKDGEHVYTVRLSHGVPFQFTVMDWDGKAIADSLEPILVPEAFRSKVLVRFQNRRPERSYPAADLALWPTKRLGPTQFEARLMADGKTVTAMFDEVGYLRMYTAKPFEVDEAGSPVRIVLPKPATLKLRFKALSDARIAACGYMIGQRIKRGGSSVVSAHNGRHDGTTLERIFTDLSPGEYFVNVFTMPTNPPKDFRMAHSGAFRDAKEIELSAGEHKTIDILQSRLDPEQFKGNDSLQLKIVYANQTPAAGEPYTFKAFAPHYGEIELTKGVLPPDGKILIPGLNLSTKGLRFSVEVGASAQTARFSITVPARGLTEALEFVLAPRVGDRMVDITFVDVQSNKTVRLSDFKGQVIFLEFWTTGCGPCQGPMAKNVALLASRGDDWSGLAMIVPVSINDDLSTLREHIAYRGWDSIRHFWSKDPQPGWNSAAPRAYVVDGVPTAILIDQDGIVRWRGHPGRFDVEHEIDALVKR